MASSKVSVMLALVALLPTALAHIGLWHPSLYGWDDDVNQEQPVNPLMYLNFTEWWFHGYLNQTPAAGEIMELPSGGTFHGEVACNKGFTTYGQLEELSTYACNEIGPLHTSDDWASPNPIDVKGCGLGIAYESDATLIQPGDFTMISLNFSCPWFREVDFQIPSDLPPCPPGGCTCMWGWVHSPDSGSEQMYMLGYRCNVTGATGTTPLPPPQVARKCPVDKTNCTVGSKQPHYWLQLEGNNNFQDWFDPPFYNDDYGFQDGAQTDLFDALSITPTYTVTSWAGYENDGPVSTTLGYTPPVSQASPSTTSMPPASTSAPPPSSPTSTSMLSTTVASPPASSTTSTSSVSSATTPSPPASSPTSTSLMSSPTTTSPPRSLPTSTSSLSSSSSSSSTSTSSSSTLAAASPTSTSSINTSATEMNSPTYLVVGADQPMDSSVSAPASSTPSGLSISIGAALAVPTSGMPQCKRSLSSRAALRLEDPEVRKRHLARAERRRMRRSGVDALKREEQGRNLKPGSLRRVKRR